MLEIWERNKKAIIPRILILVSFRNGSSWKQIDWCVKSFTGAKTILY